MLWILGILFLVPIIGYFSEKHSWNNGYCEKCQWRNGYWIYFYTDSQGGRGYKCAANRDHTTWISYPFIDPTIPQHVDSFEVSEPKAWRGRGIRRTIRRKKKRS